MVSIILSLAAVILGGIVMVIVGIKMLGLLWGLLSDVAGIIVAIVVVLVVSLVVMMIL